MSGTYKMMLRKLQWGRARESAERRLVQLVFAHALCFNGAALGRARRGRWARRAAASVRGFNGAALGRARRGRSLTSPRPRLSGFNGAALGRARRVDEFHFDGLACKKLQWGRARESAESYHKLRAADCYDELQWGRARESAERTPTRLSGSCPRGFNGAALGRARRGDDPGGAGCDVSCASMGPRSGERGEA